MVIYNNIQNKSDDTDKRISQRLTESIRTISDLSRGSGENSWYTDQFSGTSSASPIVVGALACLQSIHLTRGGRQLPYTIVREMLRTTGSPQQEAPGRPASQRISNLPDLRALISRLNGF